AKELQLLGSHGMPAHDYAPMLSMIRAGALNPRALIQKTVSLDEAGAELAAMGDFRGVGVTVVDRF
ncbi:MAG: alcohol dehydrogenase, partial [Rudaea sp.]